MPPRPAGTPKRVLVDEVLDLRAKLRAERLPVDDTADPPAEGEPPASEETPAPRRCLRPSAPPPLKR